jgi:DNA-binding FadR family transcriptional regulator
MPFEAVLSRRLYQVVADQIGQLIRAGEFRSGDRLPPERDLSRRLGVSRPVVREAMVALEIVGLVEVRGGSGVYIRELAGPLQVPDAGEGPYDAFIARRALEGEIAAAAAEHADAERLAELAAAVEQMRLEARASPPAGPGDRRFHLALAAASGNSIYVHLVRFVWDELLNRGPIWAKLGERRAVRPTRLLEHEAILAAVAARDPARARQAVHAHFDGAIRDFLEMTAGEAPARPHPPPTAAGAATMLDARE